ncbi:hypothetical protein YC2023_106021 [Brassica napus]
MNSLVSQTAAFRFSSRTTSKTFGLKWSFAFSNSVCSYFSISISLHPAGVVAVGGYEGLVDVSQFGSRPYSRFIAAHFYFSSCFEYELLSNSRPLGRLSLISYMVMIMREAYSVTEEDVKAKWGSKVQI